MSDICVRRAAEICLGRRTSRFKMIGRPYGLLVGSEGVGRVGETARKVRQFVCDCDRCV
jgi:hypothetical protein